MEGDNGDDPYSSLVALCQISNSQEGRLKLLSFAGKSDLEDDSEQSDSGEFSVESTGIVMVSLPESWEQKEDSTPHDEYHTPPEGSAIASSDGQRSGAVENDLRKGDQMGEEACDDETVISDGLGMDGARVVDLGRDTDVGFSSEVQLSQKSDQSTDVDRLLAVEERFFGKEICDSEPTCKQLKFAERIVDLEFPTFSTETTAEKASEVFLKAYDELKNVGVTPPDQTLKIDSQMFVETNCAGEKTEEESSRNSHLYFSGSLESNTLNETEVIESMDYSESINDMGLEETLAVDLEMEEAESKQVENDVKAQKVFDCDEELLRFGKRAIENTDNNGGVGMNILPEYENSRQRYEYLPPFMAGGKKKVDSGSSSEAFPPESFKEVTFLDVLKTLVEGQDDRIDGENLADLSFVEILERRGMTFPRPSWWPEGGFEVEEDEDEEER